MTAPDVQTPQVPAGASTETHDKEHLYSAAPPPVNQDQSRYARKRQARLQAEAALQGVALDRLADGRWLACHWALSKELADTEVEAWLRRVGGDAHAVPPTR